MKSLFAYRLLRAAAARRRADDDGTIMVVVVLALLVLLLGAAALASRVSFSWLGSIGQSDYRAAKEAAEYGFNEVLARMNTNTKGHLYVTKWGDWNTVTVAELKNCNIAAENLTDAQLSPATIVGTQNLPNNIGQYELVNYTPPAPLRLPTPSARNVCSSSASPFGNLFGGSATVRLVGRARRANGTVATYTLERKIHVGSLVGGRPAANSSLALLCSSTTGLGNASLWYDKNRNGFWDNNPNDDPLAILCDGPCTITGNPSGTPLSPNLDLQTPPFPVRPPELNGVTALDVPFVAAGTVINNYPYLNGVVPAGSVTNAALRSECRVNAAGDRISCLVNNLFNTQLQVYTSTTLPPVNIYLQGSIAFSDTTKSNLTGQGSGSISGISNLGVRATPSSTIASLDAYRLWKNVRVFGSPTPVAGGQYLTVRNSDRLDGLFVWMPNGTFLNAAGNSTTFGVFWVCDYRSQSAANRILGPLNPQNIDEVDSFLRDVLAGGTDDSGSQVGGSGAVGATSGSYRSSGS